MTSPVDTSVKFFHSGLTGAPSGAPIGGVIAVLDACLVTGWNALSVSSLTVVGGVATLVFGTTPAAIPGMVIEVAGATTKTALNGEQRVTAKTSNSLSFETDEPDGVAAGTITYKIAPVGGWTKPYTSTNTAVFKQGPGSVGGFYLRVYESDTANALLTGYELMSDADTGVNPFPTVSQIAAGGLLWCKGANWTLAGDDAGFHLHMSAGLRSAYYFGDALSDKVADGYSCLLTGSTVDNSGSVVSDGFDRVAPFPMDRGFFSRSPNEIGGSQVAACFAAPMPLPSATAAMSGGLHQLFPYPNPADNSLLLSTIHLTNSGNVIRGRLPGIHAIMQNVTTAFSHLDIVPGSGELTDRDLRMCQVGSPSGTSQSGFMAVDATGPWR